MNDVFNDNRINWFTDFLAEEAAQWTETPVEGGSLESELSFDATTGGVAVLTTDNADNDAINAQHAQGFILAQAAGAITIEARVKITAGTLSDFAFGFVETDTAVLHATGGVPAFNNGILLYTLEGTSNRLVVRFSDGGSTDAFTTDIYLDDATWHRIRLVIYPDMDNANNARFEVYLDDNGLQDIKASHCYKGKTTRLEQGTLFRPTLALAAREAAVKTAYCDYLRISLPRPA